MPYNDVEYQLSKYARRKKKYKDYLGGECVDCGETDYDMLEFDHVDPSTKEFEILRQWSISWEKIKPELDKCVLRCNVCHAKKTIENGENVPPMRRAKQELYNKVGG